MYHSLSFIFLITFDRAIFDPFLAKGARRHKPLKSEVAVVGVPGFVLAFVFSCGALSSKTAFIYGNYMLWLEIAFSKIPEICDFL